MCLSYFANRNDFLRDSSRIEPIHPNIRNDIVSESGLTRRNITTGEFFNETSRIPPNKKKSIRGDSSDSWPDWNRGIKWRHITTSSGSFLRVPPVALKMHPHTV